MGFIYTCSEAACKAVKRLSVVTNHNILKFLKTQNILVPNLNLVPIAHVPFGQHQ